MTTVFGFDWRQITALICAILIAPGAVPLVAQEQAAQPPAQTEEKPKLKTAEQLDSLVAPIALYPDPLLAQVLAASTYPLEVVQAQRWLKANGTKLKGEELTKAAAKQPWDASVQALVAFPDALKLLDENIQWTTELGNAFLDQQSEIMDAVQRMRKKAKDAGKLQSSKEQKVEVKTIENKTIVQVMPSDPQVIYVPTYNPTVVYGPPVYAYPPITYPPPPSTGAIVATAAVSFGVGVMMGAMWSGCCHGGWGWGCGWGGNTVVVNNNFHNRYGYNNVNNIQGGNRTNISGGNRVNTGNKTWEHNADHRRAVPYNNRETAQKFGGTARDTSGRTERFDRSGQPRASAGQLDRGPQASTRDLGAGRDRSQAAARGGEDRVGNRSLGSDVASRNSALGGSESRARTQAASDRGFSSTRQSNSLSAGGGGWGGRSGEGGSRSGRSGGGRSAGGGGRRR